MNVTKGFPLAHAEVNTLVEKTFAESERSGESLPAVEVLARLSERVEARAKEVCGREGFDTSRFEDVLQSEAFYLMATLLNRLRIIAADGRLEVGISALRRVVRQIVRQTTVPFHGEPAVGLQVLGVLETRCLDFDDVLMLSVNEGTLPQIPQRQLVHSPTCCAKPSGSPLPNGARRSMLTTSIVSSSGRDVCA